MYYPKVFDYIGEDYFYVLNRKRLSQSAQELACIKSILHLEQGEAILDLCCGIGRHALPLSKAGFKVTALDSCSSLLNLACAEADEAGLDTRFVQADMRDIPYLKKYDAVLNIWDSFGFLEDDKQHIGVLRALARSLKPGGRLLLDIPNRDWEIRNQKFGYSLREIEGLIEMTRCHFDIASGRTFIETTFIRNGEEKRFNYSRRFFTVQEINTMLEMAGLKLVQSFGGFNFQPLTLDAQRIVMVVAN